MDFDVSYADFSRHVEKVLWPIWPVLFLVSFWLSFRYRKAFLQHMPRIRWLFAGPDYYQSAATILCNNIAAATGTAPASAPAPSATNVQSPDNSYGETLTLKSVEGCSNFQAWQLGTVCSRLQLEDVSLEEANRLIASILHLPPPQSYSSSSIALNREKVLELGKAVEKSYYSWGTTRWGRQDGLFTFANALWVIGAIGISIALFPALQALIEPMGWLIVHIHYIVLPFYGLLCYALCLHIIVSASRYPPKPAPFVALTGALPAVAAFCVLALRSAPATDTGAELFLLYLPLLFGALVFVPLTLHHESALLGFVATAFVWCVLGFWMVPWALTGQLFWMDDNMYPDRNLVVFITSGTLSLVLLLMRAARYYAEASGAAAGAEGGCDEEAGEGAGLLGQSGSRAQQQQQQQQSVTGLARWLTTPCMRRAERAFRPFYTGFAVFGNIVLLFNGLEWSSRWYSGPSWAAFIFLNALYIGIALTITGAGLVLRDGMFYSTGTTFLALWLFGKVMELFDNGWIVMLLVSVALVAAGHFLRMHPDWVLRMVCFEKDDTAADGSGGSGYDGYSSGGNGGASAAATAGAAGGATGVPVSTPAAGSWGQQLPVAGAGGLTAGTVYTGPSFTTWGAQGAAMGAEQHQDVQQQPAYGMPVQQQQQQQQATPYASLI